MSRQSIGQKNKAKFRKMIQTRLKELQPSMEKWVTVNLDELLAKLKLSELIVLTKALGVEYYYRLPAHLKTR